MARSVPAPGRNDAAAASRGTPPPSYHPAQVTRLGVPPPAVTSKAMKEATKKVTEQRRTVFGNEGRGDTGSRGMSPNSRPGTRGSDLPRATSPAPARSASPQPRANSDVRGGGHRSVSPNPYGGQRRAQSQAGASYQRGADPGYYGTASPSGSVRGASPSSYRDYNRPQSSYGGAEMAVQLAPGGEDPHGSQRSRGSGRAESRAMGLYDDGGSRPRSKSVADPARMYSRDGRPIMHYGKSCSSATCLSVLAYMRCCSSRLVRLPSRHS